MNKEKKEDVGLYPFLRSHAQKDVASFHMPGHKGAAFFEREGYGDFMRHLADADITEIPGADNLFQAEDSLRAVADRYRTFYGARESFLLVGGASAGVLASILSAVRRGEEILIASNSHKSVINGIMLAGAVPVFIDPVALPHTGVSGGITAEQVEDALTAHPLCKTVLITSPTYLGICSDLVAIAAVIRAHGALFIVDESHGSHLRLFERAGLQAEGAAPFVFRSAGRTGADIVIESTHKTLASFTQSAVLNVYSKCVDLTRIADYLQMLESSSPSYLLLASLAVNIRILEKHGEALATAWLERTEHFRRTAAGIAGLKVLQEKSLDPTRISLDMSARGLSGAALSEELSAHGVIMELATGNISLAMSGIGNTDADFERLLDALRAIAGKHDFSSGPSAHGKAETGQEEKTEKPGAADETRASEEPAESELFSHNTMQKVPAQMTYVPYTEAAGKVCALPVIPYPPGIPLLIPGEVITEEKAAYAWKRRKSGSRVIGIDAQGRLAVGK